MYDELNAFLILFVNKMCEWICEVFVSYLQMNCGEIDGVGNETWKREKNI